MKRKIAILVFILAVGSDIRVARADSQSDPTGNYDVAPTVARTLEPFDLAEVRLLDGPFRDAQEVDRAYLLRLDPDRLLAPFRLDAKLPAKAESYGGWEQTGLNGHMLGHYLSAISLMYRATGDEELHHRVGYIVDELALCQRTHDDGYVGGVKDGERIWQELREGNINPSGGFTLNGGWVPYYVEHKLFAGLRDAYLLTGNEQARDVLVAAADWMVDLISNLSDEQMQRMLSVEQGGIAESLADVYALTGEQKYLDAAKRFTHHDVFDPAARGEDRLTGIHANTQVPKFIGYDRIYELSGDESYGEAAKFFWERVALARSCVYGGHSVGEYFHPIDQFRMMVENIAGPETCNTYNMLKLTHNLFLRQPTGELIDFYERALWNQILSSQHPGDGGLVYYTPLRPAHYRLYSEDFNSNWCCVGTGIENHAKYGEMIYAAAGDALLVNLFIASELDWREQGVRVRQETRFPDEPRTMLSFEMPEPQQFEVKVRYPTWVAPGKLKLRVNGEEVFADGEPGSYVSVMRTWQDGDRLEVELPMRVTIEELPGVPEYVAFLYGPIVLAGRAGTENLDIDFRGGNNLGQRTVPKYEAPTLVGERTAPAESIKRLPGDSLAFLSPPNTRPKPIEMIPFYRLHDQRYVIYWWVATPAEFDAELARAAAEAERRRELEARTIDVVETGRRRSESEHDLESENSDSGTAFGRRWRHGQLFSYAMKVEPESPCVLVATYWGNESGRRTFDILVDDKKLATENTINKWNKGEFMDVEYPLPADQLAGKSTVRVAFRAHDENIAGGVFGLRVVRSADDDQRDQANEN